MTDEVSQTYLDAVEKLQTIARSPDSSDALANEANRAIAELNAARMAGIAADFAGRTAALNFLVERLNGVSAKITVDEPAKLKQLLGTALANAQNLAAQAAIHAAVPGRGAPAAAPAEESNAADLPTAPSPSTPSPAAPSPTAADAPATTTAAEQPSAPRPAKPAPAATPAREAAKSADASRSDVPADLKQDYERLFGDCSVRPERAAEVDRTVRRLLAQRSRYEAVGNACGVPWWFVGIVHGMESSFNFDRHLHNGDPLSARTVQVPAGRPTSGQPPFTWESSAEDALRFQKLDQWKDWSLPGALFMWEKYNGFGYRNHHPDVPSPYLWSFTNRYSRGKYVADGKFDPNAVSAQCGTVAVLRALIDQGQVTFG